MRAQLLFTASIAAAACPAANSRSVAVLACPSIPSPHSLVRRAGAQITVTTAVTSALAV